MISTEYPMPLEETVELAYRAASRFTLVTGAFEADSEWFENYTDIDVHGFYHSPNPYCVIHEYDEETGETEFFDVTPEEFAAAVKKLYNVNMTAEQARLMTGSGAITAETICIFIPLYSRSTHFQKTATVR